MPAITEREPLSREEFRAALIAAVDHMKVEETRFYKLLMTGRCPRKILRGYAMATVRSAEQFCASLAEMVEKAPSPHARLVLLENLLEEEGIDLRSSTGLVCRPDVSHPALARRLATAVGATGDFANAPHASSAARELLARGDWVEAISHVLIGQEYHFANAAPVIAGGLRRCGLTNHDVAFFLVHEAADLKHGEQAIGLVLEHAHGREQQHRCIAEAQAGADAWLAAHGGLAT